MASSEDFFQVFGHISVYFATFDFLTTLTILRLVDGRIVDQSLRMNDRNTLQQKFRLIERLEPHHVTNLAVLQELQGLLPEAVSVGETRNRFIHDQWMFAPDAIPTGRITRIRLEGLESGMFRLVSEETTLADLYAFLGRIR
jgi:hypothetical protein